MTLYDVLDSEKLVGLVMEYASGGELFNYVLAQQYLQENEARFYFAQLLSGLWQYLGCI